MSYAPRPSLNINDEKPSESENKKDIILIIIVVGVIVFIFGGAVFFGIREEIRISKLPTILHYTTQLDNKINLEIWRKDKHSLNDTIIIVEKQKVKIKSIGDYLEIPFEGMKITKYKITPIRSIRGDFFSSFLTDRIEKYVIHLTTEDL